MSPLPDDSPRPLPVPPVSLTKPLDEQTPASASDAMPGTPPPDDAAWFADHLDGYLTEGLTLEEAVRLVTLAATWPTLKAELDTALTLTQNIDAAFAPVRPAFHLEETLMTGVRQHSEPPDTLALDLSEIQALTRAGAAPPPSGPVRLFGGANSPPPQAGGAVACSLGLEPNGAYGFSGPLGGPGGRGAHRSRGGQSVGF